MLPKGVGGAISSRELTQCYRSNQRAATERRHALDDAGGRAWRVSFALAIIR